MQQLWFDITGYYTSELHRKRQDGNFSNFPRIFALILRRIISRQGGGRRRGGEWSSRGEKGYWKFRVFQVSYKFEFSGDLKTTRVEEKKKEKCPINSRRLKARLKAFVCSGIFWRSCEPNHLQISRKRLALAGCESWKILRKDARPVFKTFSQFKVSTFNRVYNDLNFQICIKIRDLLIRHTLRFIIK